jgi:hypothetical protein
MRHKPEFDEALPLRADKVIEATRCRSLARCDIRAMSRNVRFQPAALTRKTFARTEFFPV